jgi:hypothetical protein
LQTEEQLNEAAKEVYSQFRLIKNESGELKVNPKIKDADKIQVQEFLNNLDQQLLAEQKALNGMKVSLRPDERELIKKQREIELTELEMRVKFGYDEDKDKATSEIINIYRQNLSEIQKEIQRQESVIINLEEEARKEIDKSRLEGDERAIQAVKDFYQKRINQVKIDLIELKNQEISAEEDITNKNKELLDLRLQSSKKYYDKLKNDSADYYSFEYDQLNQLNAKFQSSKESYLDNRLDDIFSGYDSLESERLSKLDAYRDLDLYSQEEYEKKKLAIEEEYNQKRADAEEEHYKQIQIIQASLAGQQEELTRQREIEELQLLRDSQSDKLKIYAEFASGVDENNNLIFNDAATKAEYEELKSQFENTEVLLADKKDTLGIIGNQLGMALSDTVTSAFAMDFDALDDVWREYFSKVAGMLQAKVTAFVLDLVLSDGVKSYLTALPFPLNVAAIPGITALVTQGVRAVTNPMLEQILAFPTGFVFDEPSLVQVGDGNRLGGLNREYLFRQDQLVQTLQNTIAGYESTLLNVMQDISNKLSSQELITEVRGDTLRLLVQRSSTSLNKRIR